MFSRKQFESINKGSLVRAMFEEGNKLRKRVGPENVYDFSIGNPEFEPPQVFQDAYLRIVQEKNPNKHRYMSNAGYDDVRSIIAAKRQKESGIPITQDNIIMTCGAAGAINVILKSILNPGEEVILLAPLFMEYLFYIDHNGGVPVIVNKDPETFQPVAAEIEKAINKNTKAIIINNPNNPTGVVYTQEVLQEVSDMLERKQKELGIEIYVISDEPYADIVYENVQVPDILATFKNALVVYSYSKSLALPGERIGYIAASSRINDIKSLMDILIMLNRTMGFINAPAVMQKAVAAVEGETVAVSEYEKRRDILYNHLIQLGFECIKPQGTFYLFPKTPIEDDVEFTKIALKHNILVVPGSGFKWPGYMRLAFCIKLETIEKSLPYWEALAKESFAR